MGVINFVCRMIVVTFLGAVWIGLIIGLVFIVLIGWDHILNMIF